MADVVGALDIDEYIELPALARHNVDRLLGPRRDRVLTDDSVREIMASFGAGSITRAALGDLLSRRADNRAAQRCRQ